MSNERRRVDPDEMSPEAMMLLGKMAGDIYEQNPPPVDAWVHTLNGLANLLETVATRLKLQKQVDQGMIRSLASAYQALKPLYEEMAWAYIASGAASADMLENLAEQLKEREGK